MNGIPSWIFIVVAFVGLVITIYGNKKKKGGPAFFGLIVCVAGAALFLMSYYRVFAPDSKTADKRGTDAEAFGVAQLVKAEFEGQKIAVLGWRDAKDMENYVKTLE